MPLRGGAQRINEGDSFPKKATAPSRALTTSVHLLCIAAISAIE
jgi:hypothetical protein